jgi:hypothetical protein
VPDRMERNTVYYYIIDGKERRGLVYLWSGGRWELRTCAVFNSTSSDLSLIDRTPTFFFALDRWIGDGQRRDSESGATDGQ